MIVGDETCRTVQDLFDKTVRILGCLLLRLVQASLLLLDKVRVDFVVVVVFRAAAKSLQDLVKRRAQVCFIDPAFLHEATQDVGAALLETIEGRPALGQWMALIPVCALHVQGLTILVKELLVEVREVVEHHHFARNLRLGELLPPRPFATAELVKDNSIAVNVIRVVVGDGAGISDEPLRRAIVVRAPDADVPSHGHVGHGGGHLAEVGQLN